MKVTEKIAGSIRQMYGSADQVPYRTWVPKRHGSATMQEVLVRTVLSDLSDSAVSVAHIAEILYPVSVPVRKCLTGGVRTKRRTWSR